MATEQKQSNSTIKAFNVLQLSGLLKRCTNIPLADLNDFITYLELRDKLNEIAISLDGLQKEIFISFGVEPDADGRFFATQEHESFSKINSAMESLMNREHEINGIKSLNISRLELAQICAGLKNLEVDFVKEWLSKPAA